MTTPTLKKLCGFEILSGPSKMELMLHVFDRLQHPVFKMTLGYTHEFGGRGTTLEEFSVVILGPVADSNEIWNIEVVCPWDVYLDDHGKPASIYRGQYRTDTRKGNLDRLVRADQ
jgi:hypothetical protein